MRRRMENKRLTWFALLTLAFLWTIPVHGQEGEGYHLKLAIEMGNFTHEIKVELDRDKERLRRKIEATRKMREMVRGGASRSDVAAHGGIVSELTGVAGEEGSPRPREEGEDGEPEESDDWLGRLWDQLKDGVSELKKLIQPLLDDFFSKKEAELDDRAKKKAEELADKYPEEGMDREDRVGQIFDEIDRNLDKILAAMRNDLENSPTSPGSGPSRDLLPTSSGTPGGSSPSSSRGTNPYPDIPAELDGDTNSSYGGDLPGPSGSDDVATARTPSPSASSANRSDKKPSPTMKAVKKGAVMGRGHSGQPVKDLQNRLTKLGFGVRDTGLFGPTTEGILKDFQRAYGVQPTGKLGPTTLKALERAEQFPYPVQKSSSVAYENGRRLGSIRVAKINGKPVSLNTARAYHRMSQAAKAQGIYLHIVSGFRSYSEQSRLWRAYLNGTGNPANQPGYSNHQNGLALDLNTHDPGVYSWLSKNAGRFGFKRTVPREPWHWEYRP